MAAFAAPQHPPIPSEEFDQPEMLAIEKESIGLFISAHPLKQVREALRVRVDCGLAELAERKDGDWVTAGGIITQAKKIRTRNGDHMMFATLDDLEGSVEVIVFGKALGEFEGALGVDSVVLVRGRVDHKEATKTSLVAQTVEPFEPSEDEIEKAKREASTRRLGPPPLKLRLDAARLPASAIDDLKDLLGSFPGESEVVLELLLSVGDPRTLRLGNAFKVAPTPTLRAELEQILGPAVVRAPAAAAPTAAA
jgi:DNA polymerase-3 subunit alpha